MNANESLMEVLVRWGTREQAMQGWVFAVRVGSFYSAQWLWSGGGVDVNASLVEHKLMTPLAFSCQRSRFHMVRLLLQWGADPNALCDFPWYDGCPHVDKMTALCIAASHRDERAVPLLLAHGASVESAEDYTAGGGVRLLPPLWFAVQAGLLPNVDSLLQAGACANADFPAGIPSLLQMAVNRVGVYRDSRSARDIVEALVWAGADTSHIQQHFAAAGLDHSARAELMHFVDCKACVPFLK